jgi:two-component system, response regulator PdtaR
MQNPGILIIEDEIIVATDLSFRLESMGFRVTSIADSAEEALESFKMDCPDLILSDINLRSSSDGIDIARLLQEIQMVPVIYLTAQSDAETVERAKTTFPAAYLTKPFDDRQLKATIAIALHNFAATKTGKNIEKQETKPVSGSDTILHAGEAIFIKQGYKFIKLSIQEVLFISADGIYTDIITRTNRYALRMPLNQVMDKLSTEFMVRTHRSYAVNITNIDEFNDSEIVIGSSVVPIGASYKEGFLRSFDVK